jgi:hypothetical protein
MVASQVQDSETRRILREMLTENTGRAMCDSGDYYGRNWQMNQGKDFDAMPASILRAYVRKDQLDLELTHNVYHWLAEKLDYAPKMDRMFRRFSDRRNGDSWLQEMEEFTSRLEQHGATGIYGDGSPMTVNTYNGEDLLSQVLQYCYFEFQHESYVLLQIHGGCDVRGGYTRPRAFTLNSELNIFDNARAVLYPDPQGFTDRHQLNMFTGRTCEDTAPNWFTDDGCHFYSEGAGRQQRLENFPASEDADDRGKGIIYVDEDCNLYCPISGRKLFPSFF